MSRQRRLPRFRKAVFPKIPGPGHSAPILLNCPCFATFRKCHQESGFRESGCLYPTPDSAKGVVPIGLCNTLTSNCKATLARFNEPQWAGHVYNDITTAAGRMVAACGRRRERKVRAPQDTVMGNAHRPQGQGKCNRKD